MKLTRLFLVFASFTAIVVASDTAVLAASKTSSFNVTSSVAANCSISTVDITFGPYDPISGSDLNVNGSVTVACTKGATTPSIALGMGNNSATTTPDNAMKNGGNTDLLKYSLYQDSGYATRWNGASMSIPASGKTGVPYTIYGKVLAGQDVSVGSYSDVVVATINY
jgi:spore coat protein U-like protein